jgi:hypothetical protein
MKKASLRIALIDPFASGILGYKPNKNSRISLDTPKFDKLFFNIEGRLYETHKKKIKICAQIKLYTIMRILFSTDPSLN